MFTVPPGEGRFKGQRCREAVVIAADRLEPSPGKIITSKKFSYHSIRAEIVRFVSGHRFSDDAKGAANKALVGAGGWMSIPIRNADQSHVVAGERGLSIFIGVCGIRVGSAAAAPEGASGERWVRHR
jgi:hypothetical protein